MYRLLAKIYPRNIRERYKKILQYSGIKIDATKFLGFVLFFGFGLALAFSMIVGAFVNVSLLLLFITSFFIFQCLSYIPLILRADAKARFIENVLPDALQLMASNLRAGLTVDKALLLSARPEFGPLQDEINWVGKEITIGKSISESLLDMSEHIKSEKLRKTVLLINSGLKSGGELASLLEQISTNLREQTFVEEKTRSSITMYLIFISVAVAVGSPALFGLSSFLVEVLKSNLSSINLPDNALATANLPLSFTEVSISVNFIITFAVTSLITSSILGSMMIGLISKGKEKHGFKFIPIIMAISLTIFFMTRVLIRTLLGGLFGI